jgi:hypothetical protein
LLASDEDAEAHALTLVDLLFTDGKSSKSFRCTRGEPCASEFWSHVLGHGIEQAAVLIMMNARGLEGDGWRRRRVAPLSSPNRRSSVTILGMSAGALSLRLYEVRKKQGGWL